MLFFLISFSFDELLRASEIQISYIVICVVSFVLYRLFLCLAVNIDVKERNAKGRVLWSLSTFFFGIVVPIIYAVANYKKKASVKFKSKNVFITLFMILLILSNTCGMFYYLSLTGEFGYILDPDDYSESDNFVYYENDKGKKVLYDKMGNEYRIHKYEEPRVLYFDEDGNSYERIDDFWSTLRNTESGQIYTVDDYGFFINDEGYLCLCDNSENLNEYHNDYCFVYYDDEHLYFDISDVSWNKDGEIVFPEFIDEVNNFTYDMVINESKD